MARPHLLAMDYISGKLIPENVGSGSPGLAAGFNSYNKAFRQDHGDARVSDPSNWLYPYFSSDQ